MQKPISNKKTFVSLLKDFSQNIEQKKLLENNLTEPSFKLLRQMSKEQIHLYIGQAQRKGYELIIQTNPVKQYPVYREIKGLITEYDVLKNRILVENQKNNIVFVIPLNFIRFVRRSG